MASISSCAGVVTRDRLTAFGVVDRQPRRREAQRARPRSPPPPACASCARSSAVAGSRSTPRWPITYTRSGECGRNAATSMSRLPRVERVEELGEGLPRPRQPVDHHDAGDVLHAGHHVDEHVVVLGAARREADAAVAHHRGGDAVRRRRRHAVRPDGLAVVVGVQVDEAGRDQQAGRVDLARRRRRRRCRPRRSRRRTPRHRRRRARRRGRRRWCRCG